MGQDSDLFIKSVTETVENKIKEQRGQFFGVIQGTLGAIVLGDMLASKGAVRADDKVIVVDDVGVGAGQYF